MNLFENTGMTIGNLKYLSPKEANALSEQVVFIDLRPDYETVGKRIRVKTIVFLPWKEFEQSCRILKKENHFIVFDEVGLHSKEILRFMTEHGFEKVAGMAGGIVDWEKDGLPMDIDKGELMTGSCLCTLKPKKNFNKE